MSSHAEIKVEDGVLCVSGHLDFSNVMLVYRDSLQLIASLSAPVTIDFSQLISTNSAALAIVISWMKYAKKSGISICFRNMSADIISLAKSSGLYKIIQPLVV